jgi:cobalamin biosynthesis protein CbiG
MSVNSLKEKVANSNTEKKTKTLMDVVTSEGMKKQMMVALLKHIKADRMARVVLTELKKTKISEMRSEFFSSVNHDVRSTEA